MSEQKPTVTQLKCLRCSHEWLPRSTDLPKNCPVCKSPYWNKPRRIEILTNPSESKDLYTTKIK